MAVGNMKDSTDAACDLLGGFFTTLAHPTRMRIFCALQSEAKSVTDIASYAGISIANASQHLRRMRDKGTVVSEKCGQSVYYRIADSRFLYAANLIRQALVEQTRNKVRGGRGLFSKNLSAVDFNVDESPTENQA